MEISASSQQNKAYVLLAKIGSHPCLTSRGAGRSEDLQWAQATNDSLQGREEEQRSCPSKHAGVTYAQCGTLLLHRHMDSFRDTGSDMLLASVQRPLTVNKGMLRSAILLQKPSHIAGTQKNLLRVAVDGTRALLMDVMGFIPLEEGDISRVATWSNLLATSSVGGNE